MSLHMVTNKFMRGKLRDWLELRSIIERSARSGRKDSEARQAFSILRTSKQASKRYPESGCVPITGSMRRKPTRPTTEHQILELCCSASASAVGVLAGLHQIARQSLERGLRSLLRLLDGHSDHGTLTFVVEGEGHVGLVALGAQLQSAVPLAEAHGKMPSLHLAGHHHLVLDVDGHQLLLHVCSLRGSCQATIGKKTRQNAVTVTLGSDPHGAGIPKGLHWWCEFTPR
ncbi:hypothetical protein Mapa_006066 [Marchantia paleacea]|nr:hypothetical protein Mapa_006066 [Marchantia paleacea]